MTPASPCTSLGPRPAAVLAFSVVIAAMLSAYGAGGGDNAAVSTTVARGPASTTTSEPAALTFYRPSTVLDEGRPGAVLSTEPTTIDPSWPGTASRITYVSTTPAGDLVPVTGVVMVPAAPAPSAGYPVVVGRSRCSDHSRSRASAVVDLAALDLAWGSER